MKPLRCSLAVLFLTTVSPVRGDVIRVPADYATIWEAVDAAVAGDSVLVGPGTWTDTDTREVVFGGGTVTVTSCGFLKGGISVIGEAGASATVVDPDAVGYPVVTFLLSYEAEGETVLEGLTVTGSGTNQQPVFATYAPRLVIRACRFVGNEIGNEAWVIRIDNTDLVMEDTEVSFNAAEVCLAIVESSIELYRCRFEGNQGGAIYGGGGETGIVMDCEFIDNRNDCTAGAAIGGFASPVIVERNLFLRNTQTGYDLCTGGALLVGMSTGRIAFNTFAFDSSAGGGGGLAISGCPNIKVVNNTFFGCHGPTPSAVGVGNPSNVEFANNIVGHSTGGFAMFSQFGGISGGCNDYWANEGGDFFFWEPIATDFFEDPRYCAPRDLDFTLQQDSPCAPGNTPGCAQVGAWGVGCGTVSMEPSTWGRIKGMYRQEEQP